MKKTFLLLSLLALSAFGQTRGLEPRAAHQGSIGLSTLPWTANWTDTAHFMLCKDSALAYGVQNIATSAATTTLINTSPYMTVFTGFQNQTEILPNATTCLVGLAFETIDSSTGAITVQTNGAATLFSIASKAQARFVLADNSTAAGIWKVSAFLTTTGTAADVNVSGTAIAAALSGKLGTAAQAADVNVGGTAIASALSGKLGTGGTAADVNVSGTNISGALAGKLGTGAQAADVNVSGTAIAAALSGKQATISVAANSILGNNTGAPTSPTSLTQTQATAMLNLATTSLQGAMSANDKTVLTNMWIDVTANATALVLPGNTAAQNITNLNAILAAATNGSTIYFPPGMYQFNAAWTMPAKMFTFCGRGSNRAGSPATAFTELRWIANVGGNLITLSGSGNGWYTQFRDLTFTCATADQASGYVISANGNVGVNILNCSFQSAGTYFYDVLGYDGGAGSNSGNSTLVFGCNIQGFKDNGIRVNAAGSSLVINSTTIQGQWGTSTQVAATCISCGWVGALQMIGTDCIGAVNNLLCNPVAANSEVCASIFVMGAYFDNSYGSCIKVTGTGATVRAKFSGCSFTTSNASTGFSAVELASSFAYAAGGQGIDFINCNVLNTFGTGGTTNGFLVSGTADFTINECRIAGWTNGIQVTPIATNGRTEFVCTGNTIGPTGGFAGNTTGILLNAGSAQYGTVMVLGNDMDGNTTALTDNSTITALHLKNINENTGIASQGAQTTISATAQSLVASSANLVTGTSIALPTNGLRVGSKFRFDIIVTKTGAGTATWTAVVKYGTANTTSDAAIATFTSGTNTALADVADITIFVEVLTLGASATAKSFMMYGNSYGTAATGLGSMPLIPGSTAAFNSTSASPYLHIDITPGASAVMTSAASAMCIN